MGKGQDLLNAARAGDKWTVEKIIGILTKRSGPFTNFSLRKCGLNVQDDNGYTPLHHACLNGHTEVVRLLLSAGASPAVIDKTGASPLHLAAWKGDSAIVTMLLAHNPPVNIDLVTADLETPLIMAAQYGSVNVVAQLVDRGADVTLRNVKDESALDLAAQYGRLPTVKHLLATHPTLVHQYKYPKWKLHKFSSTPLHRAAKNGHGEVVQVLLAAGIDPNIRTSSGTPLHEAACFGKASVVRILLEAGADLNEVDGRDKTVEELLADYSEEATRRVRRAIREFKNSSRNNYESEEEPRPFSLQDCSPTSYPHIPVMKAPETQKNNNSSHSLLTPSSSFVTKNSPQSFVKKLASKCLGLKAKFNSAPNISNHGLESNVDGKLKHSDTKNSATALHIGNSKFFKILSKKEESGDIPCNDEFDTISLDRLGTLNRDSAVNRSNRSCPGFKTSLPNISENNELSNESIAESSLKQDPGCDKKNEMKPLSEAINYDTKHIIFEPRKVENRISVTSNISLESANLVNECYESYDFDSENNPKFNSKAKNLVLNPKPSPRSNLASPFKSENTIYENILPEKNSFIRPTPAARTHIPTKVVVKEDEKKVLYENILLQPEIKVPEPPKRNIVVTIESNNSSPCISRTSTMSSDSMIDESNLEDILLSEKSRSFRHGQKLLRRKESSKSSIHRTQSNASEFSNTTEVSAIENVDCSAEIDEKSMYASMVGTLPNRNTEKVKKKVLFRHKTFTNIEHDRNSMKNFPKRNDSFLKDTLASYHIRGTGHCIYKAPTVKEFIYIFNRETLYRDVEPFTKVPNNKRDSYFETAICFCRPRPSKHHTSAEDLLDIQSKEEVEEKASIDMDAFVSKMELVSSSFRCFCESGTCSLHASKREFPTELVVKFSAIKKSISTPDITLEDSPSSTVQKRGLLKNKSVPANLEEPYAVVNIDEVVKRSESNSRTETKISNLDSPTYYVSMSPHSSLTSTGRPYSIKDISEVISLGSNSTSTGANSSCASDTSQLHKSNSEHSGHWSLQSCNSNLTVVSDVSFKTCLEESSDESDATIHSDDESSDAETVKSDVSTTKRPWIHSSSFRFGIRETEDTSIIEEGSFGSAKFESSSSKFESGISVDSESSSSDCGGDSGVPGESCGVSLGASLERGGGLGRVRSGSGRRRWDEAEGASEGDALSVSSAASSCAPLHMAHHHEYSKVSPTPPKKPPRRNLSVSPTHVNSPSSGYSYELRAHARSQDDLDEIQDAKHYLKHGRSVDQYVDSKLSYSEYEENHNSPRAIPVPNPRPSLKNRTQPVAITAMYENVVIKEQNPRRKLRRNTFGPQHDNFETRMADKRVRKYSNQERSSMESLLDDQSMNSPSECERYSSGSRVDIPLSPTHYEQPPTPDHPPPSARQAENSIHERIRPLSQLIMEVVEEIRIRKKSQGDIVNS